MQVIINNGAEDQPQNKMSDERISRPEPSNYYRNDGEACKPCQPESLGSLKDLFQQDRPIQGFYKLPEWDGFWTKPYDNVLVFTKDNQLLETPDYETWGHRTDYAVITPDTQYGNALMVRVVKSTRVKVDTLMQQVKYYQKSTDAIGMRETALVVTNLQNSFMWLGKFLGTLGDQSPYKESFNPKSKVIEKHADLYKGEMPEIKDTTAYFNQLRLDVSAIKDLMSYIFYMTDYGYAGRYFTIHPKFKVMGYLQDSLNWLGQQLNNFRIIQEAEDEQKSKLSAANSLVNVTLEANTKIK